MVKVDKSYILGEKVEGIMLLPQQVGVMGLIDGRSGYAVGIRVISDAGEALTIMLPVEFVSTFIRLLETQRDELQAGIGQPRN